MFKNYDKKIREMLSAKNEKTDWKRVLKEHRKMIAVIQHERLIHLMVTIFVGIVMSMAFFTTIILGQSYLLLLDIPLLMLFVGYLFHYRFLENTTQRWYLLTESIKESLD